MVILKNLRAAVTAVTKCKSLTYVAHYAFVDVALISDVAVAITTSWVDQLNEVKPTAMSPGPDSSYEAIRISASIMSPCADAIRGVVLLSCNIHSNLLRTAGIDVCHFRFGSS